MHPILATLHLGPFERVVTSYGVALAVAVALGAALAARGARRAGLDPVATLSAVGFAATGGFAGGTALHTLVELARTGSWHEAVSRGGLVFYGAALGGVGTLAFVARPLGLPLGRLLDAAALPAVPVAHAVGRVGCFFAGCCYGAPTAGPLAVTATHPLAAAAHPVTARHPVQLYEAAGLLGLAALFACVPSLGARPGARFVLYASSYAVLRFSLEGLRGDGVRGFLAGGLLSTSQAVSIGVVAASAVWAFLHARSRAEARA